MVKEYQEHGGAVSTSTSPKVQYGYSEMTGGANHSRRTSMTYPNGKVLSFNYSTGLNDSTLESYEFLDLGTVVKWAQSQPGVDLRWGSSSSRQLEEHAISCSAFLIERPGVLRRRCGRCGKI